MRTLFRLLAGLLLLATSPGMARAADPPLTVIAPQEGAVVEGSSVRVVFATSGFTVVPAPVSLGQAGQQPQVNRPGEGHVHLLLDLQPLVTRDQADPYTFSNVPPGEHQLTVELANNDHSSLTPPVLQRIQFRTTAGPSVSSPAAGQTGGANTPPPGGTGATTLPRTGEGDSGPLPRLLTLLIAAMVAMVVGVALRRRVGRST